MESLFNVGKVLTELFFYDSDCNSRFKAVVMPSDRADEYFVCPHCGCDVLVTANFCRECGADERSGWSDDGQGYDDGEDDFDYDDFVRRELPEDAEPQPKNIWLVVLIVVLCLGMLGLFF